MNTYQLRYSLTFLLLIGTLSFSYGQGRTLQVTNTKTSQTKIIKEDRRVKIWTTDGRKVVGQMKILQNDQIAVGRQFFNLSDITKIKRSPWILSALTSGGTLYVGGMLLGIGTIVAVFGGPQPLVWLGTGAALVAVGASSFGSKAKPVEESDLKFEVMGN